MTLIVDTSGILTQLEPRAPVSIAIASVLRRERTTPILPQTVAAELDYMLTSRGGRLANRQLLQDLAAGRFSAACLEPRDFKRVEALNNQYSDLGVGLSDLSIVVLAARFNTLRILTLDQRHFRTLQPLQGGTFTLLPFDDDPAN